MNVVLTVLDFLPFIQVESSFSMVLIKSTPQVHDHNMLDEILVSSPCLEGHDKGRKLSGVAA